jgi:hypothetical protein
MKLKLPNRKEIELDSSLPYADKRVLVDKILAEWLPYYNETFEKNGNTKTALDILGNYLGKEPRVKEVE